MSTKELRHRTTTATSAFPNQMIEQINIIFDKKGPGATSAWVIEALRHRRLTSEKEGIYIN